MSFIDYGIIERIEKNSFYVLKQYWAPGIWAGIEGQKIMFSCNKKTSDLYEITFIDLKTRKISVNIDLENIINVENETTILGPSFEIEF